ncbi:MAG TPA: ABC transporter ATP-binding protein [Candidatus Baltobacteraceae bacterium]|nr:ABC transporter ATP-binding protein [Candidatus Baltobacteraceae bacterium]
MLRVTNLQVYYGRIHALRAASLHVRPREIVALLGGNGSGKTTLLSAISGVVRPAAGKVVLGGQEITTRRPDQIVAAGLAHVPEARHVFKPLSVQDNLLLGAYHRFHLGAGAAIRREVEEIIELFPALKNRRNQPAGTLSGGEQQMLAIGRALLAQPRVLLLDEPSMGLAPLVIREIFQHIARLRSERGVTILLVEQNAKAALTIADRGYVLETGRVVLEGSAEDLMANRDVQRAYLGRERDVTTR